MTTYVCGAGGFSPVEADPIEAPDASGPNRDPASIPDGRDRPTVPSARVKCPAVPRDWGWPPKSHRRRSSDRRPSWRMAFATAHHLQRLEN